MANCVIQQSTLWNLFTAGEDIIFVISNDDAVANQVKVKFVAKVHIGTTQPNLSSNLDLIGTFKTTPNNAGVGIFNVRNVIENYVKADHTASMNSSYKGTVSTVDPYPLHLIDRFSLNTNTVRHLAIRFEVEFLDQDPASNTYGQIISTGAINSSDYKFFNGYLKYTDELQSSGNNFGYFKINDFYPATGARFLTNAPTTQYANFGDYGTLAFLVPTSFMAYNAGKIELNYFNDNGTPLGSAHTYSITDAQGAYDTYNNSSEDTIIYVGVYPGNIEGFSPTAWAGLVSGGLSYYTVNLKSTGGGSVSETITINLNCPNLRGYESIRICWLNQWGVWDYYTFTKKSIKTLSTQGTTYTQLEGTWNESTYQLSSFKGGKKSFRRNATEKIVINSDFVSESYNVMFEELINSPEVYLLQGLQADGTYIVTDLLNQYVTPVRVSTSNFARKTVANDKLIQYTFEIEKSKTLRTQSI